MTHMMWHLRSLARQLRAGWTEVPGENSRSRAGGESSRKEHSCSDNTGVQELQHPLRAASALFLARKPKCQHSREFPGASIMPVHVMQSFHCLVNKTSPRRICSHWKGLKHPPGWWKPHFQDSHAAIQSFRVPLDAQLWRCPQTTKQQSKVGEKIYVWE